MSTSCSLYFAFAISPDYQSRLDQLPPSVSGIWIRNEGNDYLQKIEFNGILYLGKKIEDPIETTLVDNHILHLESLLKRLVPDYPYKKETFALISIMT